MGMCLCLWTADVNASAQQLHTAPPDSVCVCMWGGWAKFSESALLFYDTEGGKGNNVV